MLRGEGNAGERSKTTAIGLISKKTTLHMQHTFLVFKAGDFRYQWAITYSLVLAQPIRTQHW